MAPPVSSQPVVEHFSSYRERCWHPAQPLAVLHQWFEEGSDTGAWQHADFYALYVIRGGGGIHVINEHPYPIHRGDVYITPPGSVHSYRDYRQLQAVVFCFEASLFSDEELDSLSTLPGFHNLFVRGKARVEGDDHSYQLHLSPEDYRTAESLTEDVLAEIERGEIVSPVVVRGMLFRMLVFLARARQHAHAESAVTSGIPADARARGDPMLAEILHICDTRYAEALTIRQLAALVFLSPGHFSEVFTREVGTPPATYLRGLRLARAQTLLRTTDLTIAGIARQSGFGDSAHLSRTFKSVIGMTPRDYRRKYRQ